ncbi:spore protease [Alkalithermobacter thermoalcaliphilus JW-YL-7 = DSM 7308]|uniref:Germination protease n=1 Tax=Alkalithermobacter thermoalcaliphilus JW-YL-7 = DSM 7308 TaxID=1121328 RepID=A0A150FR74_CLOPD|nr:Germination protease [[Clostridium] paradoxum JW-YL-7 = DSM 7308]SHL01481.1 spore protease [[Clostridium] paradoxum JW-YL-7 = DSM 7308]
MINRNIRTDLAIEARELYSEDKNVEIPGVKVDQKNCGDYTVTKVDIFSEEGKNIMGKEKGVYITIESKLISFDDDDARNTIIDAVHTELSEILGDFKNKKALVIGLGNWNITSDSLGPKVVSRILVTRHLFEAYNKEYDDTLNEVAALSPGVMGITGIETSEIVKSLVDMIKPDVVIAVDALASRKLERVNNTVQISTAGISPGAGIGNMRKALNREYLNVPIIAIGVPTVVDAATLTSDVIDCTIDNLMQETQKGKDFYKMLKSLREEEKYSLIKDVLEPYGQNVVVTPKDIDEIIDNVSYIISSAINKSLHPGIN